MEREKIKANICYTELVYDRIRKKLNIQLDNVNIENLISKIISDDKSILDKRGKNFYVANKKMGIEVTINSNNYRVITASKVI